MAFGVSFVMLLMLAQPASAIQTGSINDDPNDAGRWFSKGIAIPAYLDIAGATLAKNHDGFTMTMKVADAIPDSPELILGIQTLAWQWAFRTGGGSHPLSHHLVTDEDYMVSVMWDGEAWSAQLWDFVNAQESGGFFQVLDIQSFSVDDDIVSVIIDSSWMDNFHTCEWAVQVRGYMSPPLGTDGFNAAWWFDIAGYDSDTGEFTAWPK